MDAQKEGGARIGLPNQDSRGVRFGVISFNSLQPWCSEDLFCGQNARDLSYEEALLDLKREAVSLYDGLLEECCTAAAESGADREVGFDQEAFEQEWFAERKETWDRDDFIQDFVERNAEHIQIDEPIIEGEYDDVKYRISWLGGAPLLWVLEGPIGYVNRLCSLCVPNAGDLDSGFITGEGEGNSEDHRQILGQGFRSYVVPVSWLADDPQR